MPEYTREQLAKLYKGLPQELKDWIGSEDANDAIYQILKENDVLDEKCEQISILTRNILLGLLPMENFQETIEKDVGLKKDLANKISDWYEIDPRLVLSIITVESEFETKAQSSKFLVDFFLTAVMLLLRL